MDFVRKNKKALMVVGAVAAVVVVGKIANDHNGWYNKLTGKLLPGVPTPVPAAVRAPAPAPATVASTQPRGRLAWSVGDVNLWDDENPNYCSGCADVCDQSYSSKSSTQCDQCQAGCAAGKRF